MPTRTIAVANIKGGVGKTTLVVNLASGLARLGHRVLVVDVDAQANATFALLGVGAPSPTLVDVLVAGTATLAEAIAPSRIRGVDLVPSEVGLAGAEAALAEVPGREQRLAQALRGVRRYDHILVDAPPALGLLTVSSLLAVREVIVPVSIGVLSLMGLAVLEESIALIHRNFQRDRPVITGAVVTLYDRTRVAEDTFAAVRAHFGPQVFCAVLPRYKDFQEAQSRALGIFDYAPASPAAQAVTTLTEEVLHAGA